MAYIAFRDFDDSTTTMLPWPTAPFADAIPATVERLTDLEWQVVAIARRDGRGTLRKPGFVESALRMLSGRRNPRLTDQRLEALRRMAVLTWQRGYAVAPHEVRAFLEAGYTARQYETLADHIGAVRLVPGL